MGFYNDKQSVVFFGGYKKMDFRYKPAVRAISLTVLFFFCWTFGGVFDVAYAVKNSSQHTVDSSQENPTKNTQQSKTQKPEEKFQKTIEDIENILADTSTDTDTKKNKLKTKKSEIESLDVEIKKQFSDTEKKLKDEGLPNEILQRHYDFVKKYDDNLNELKNNLDAIDKAKDKKEADDAIEKTKKFLEKVKSPKKYVPLDPNKLPFTTPEVKTFETIEKQNIEEQKTQDSLKKNAAIGNKRLPILIASAGSLDGLLAQASDNTTTTQNSPPTEADLSETLEIKFTPEINAKVAEIGTLPVKLFEYVRNHFTYEPYYGSLKGSQQTLLEMAGNDIDLASVLIALLRSANIPSRYACGTIELSMDDLMNWLGGIKDPNTAAQIMATNGIPGTLLTEGGTIKLAQFSHCWAEAYVDMFPSMGSVNKQGKYWTPIDPSFKEMKIADSINISKQVPFDETAYINTADEMPPVLSYIYKLKDYYNTNFDYEFYKIFHVAINVDQEFGIFLGTLPYKTINEQRYSEIPDTKRHKIRFGLSSNDGETVYVEKALPEIAGKKITISYSAATPNDQDVINKYGGLLSTPAYLINVKPEIKLNDTSILSGPVIGLGGVMKLTTELSSPNLSTDIRTTDITHGISYAIGIPILNYSSTQQIGQVDTLRVLQGYLDDSINAMDSRAGELLYNIALEYFNQLNGLSKSIEGVMHVHNTKMPSIALVSADATYNEIFGMPISPPIMKGLGIDAIRVASSPFSIDGDMAQRKEFLKHRGLNSSYLEHKILENLLGEESISAVKALQIAAQNGMPIYTINQSSINSILPILTISATDKADIQNAINAGKEVIVSRDNVTLQEWSGVGYIVRDPNTGAGTYMISNSLGGGGTVSTSNPAFDKEQKIAWFIAGQPLRWYENILWWLTEDLVLLTAVIPIWQHFGYIPSATIDITNAELVKYAANHPNTWIFHYSGHAWYVDNPESDYLEPANGEFVFPNDIHYPNEEHSDCKIVFLNGCGSAHYGSFQQPFGIDQKHRVDSVEYDRKEALLGWDSETPIVISDAFALEFWMLMGSGMTVNEAINYIKAIDEKSGYLLFNSNKLKPPFGDGNTTLIP
jgi:hypothetical protein